MHLEGFHSWHYPDHLLDRIHHGVIATKHQNDAALEARIISQFARLVFPGERCRVRLFEGAFPDAEIKILESGYVKPIEITQAFEGGDNSPSRESRLYNEAMYRKAKRNGFQGNDFSKMMEYEFIRGVKLAIQRKVDKNYALRPHLLVYVTNIPTWGEAADFLEENIDLFKAYHKYFHSISVLTQNAEIAIQLLPKFKVFREKLH